MEELNNFPSMFADIISPDKMRLEKEITDLGADPYALKIASKGLPCNIKLRKVKSPAANIIKQEAIASGIDAAVHKRTVECGVEYTDILLCGNVAGVRKLTERLSIQPYGLKNVALDINRLIEKYYKTMVLKVQDLEIDLSEKILMPIINVTPDSFSDGGLFDNLEDIENYFAMLKELGVSLIDIGGESTRPGADPVPLDEELKRVLPIVEIAVSMGFLVSVDTYKGGVAKEVLKKGARLINDVSGLNHDKDMASICADFDAAVSIMHMKGEPKTMQMDTSYDNLLEDIKDYIERSIEKALSAGINENSIIVDPGFGFGKSLRDNYIILKYLNEFKSFGMPILVGLSRKSMIGNVIGKPVGERAIGSIVAETIALMNGADIVRAHDVLHAIDMLKIFNYYNGIVY